MNALNICLRLVFSAFVMLFLSACLEHNHNSSYEYLLLHPRKLQSEMASCQDEATASGKISPQCKMVIKAADQIMGLAEDQQKYPEKFGQRILRAQMDYAKNTTPENREKVQVLLLVVGLSSPE